MRLVWNIIGWPIASIGAVFVLFGVVLMLLGSALITDDKVSVSRASPRAPR